MRLEAVGNPGWYDNHVARAQPDFLIAQFQRRFAFDQHEHRAVGRLPRPGFKTCGQQADMRGNGRKDGAAIGGVQKFQRMAELGVWFVLFQIGQWPS